MFEFQRTAAGLLGAEITLYSHGALSNEHVSTDLAAATPLRAATQATRTDLLGQAWANLYDLRNHLAHSRLPDVDEGLVQRFTWARLDSLRGIVRQHLLAQP